MENLANMAFGLLAQGEGYDELAGIKCEFGYVFDIDHKGLEALFKIITDQTTNCSRQRLTDLWNCIIKKDKVIWGINLTLK